MYFTFPSLDPIFGPVLFRKALTAKYVDATKVPIKPANEKIKTVF